MSLLYILEPDPKLFEIRIRTTLNKFFTVLAALLVVLSSFKTEVYIMSSTGRAMSGVHVLKCDVTSEADIKGAAEKGKVHNLLSLSHLT